MERIPCHCKGCYADDCIVNMVTNWKCFIVATCDKELRGRVRKIPGVPCMYISGYRYTVRVSLLVCWLLMSHSAFPSRSLTLRPYDPTQIERMPEGKSIIATTPSSQHHLPSFSPSLSSPNLLRSLWSASIECGATPAVSEYKASDERGRGRFPYCFHIVLF